MCQRIDPLLTNYVILGYLADDIAAVLDVGFGAIRKHKLLLRTAWHIAVTDNGNSLTHSRLISIVERPVPAQTIVCIS